MKNVKLQIIRHFESKIGGVTALFVFVLAVSFVTRCALLAKTAADAGWDLSLLGAFALGMVFDAGFALIPAAVAALFLAATPPDFFSRRIGRALALAGIAIGVGIALFSSIAEWLFWDEFGTRFNFIAVDYLIYTTEVMGNIRESYNMEALFGALGAATVFLTLLLWRSPLCAWIKQQPATNSQDTIAPAAPPSPVRVWKIAAMWILAAIVSTFALDVDRSPSFANTYNAELARNGPWSLFSAFWNNEIDYGRLYATLPNDEAFAILKKELQMPESGKDSEREVTSTRPTITPNIIQITVESLSAEFLGAFNPASKLTPNLDALASKSLFFENFYATGTRTDRGMEALTLALPPTPGRSIIKRPANSNLFTLGSVLRTRGYETTFIYGGYGYFDNMNTFFSGNGYRIIDRRSVDSSDVTFSSIWGACDENLLDWTLREARAATARNAPFHFFVMTTSNHRPYTFPEGRIDLPSKISGREGAVKYTDYAIGRFLEKAKSEPWFKNTVFVIVADHCASSAGKTALPVNRYHIPLLIYAPGGHIAPGRVSTLTSQIDYAPTLLGLLGWNYKSRFFGRDVLAPQPTPPQGRALIGTYQKLGYFDGSRLTILSPLKGTAQYDWDAKTLTSRPAAKKVPEARATAIAYYQTASWLYKNKRYPEAENPEAKK
ncbi:MAG: LTA synthase family protein [Puniceicoccales bacterium]|jgi:phosphoglycerol transferase MdoB-like AlkP superfamily enzyme|nr:LTA synthase family protein [Puniceicoccales bacterium]